MMRNLEVPTYPETIGKAEALWKGSPRFWVATLVMLASLGLATWLTPRATWYDRLGRPDYQSIVPLSFGDWVSVGADTAGVVSPTQGEALRAIYSQIVSRTYLHRPTGRRVMLSIAYGEMQQGHTELHRPESCYSSQGFAIKNVSRDRLNVGARSLGIFRMTAIFGGRHEQVTYWIRMGDRVLDGAPHQLGLTRMAMGLKGIVADGLLFRLSEIAPLPEAADRLEDRFVVDLLRVLSPAQQATLIGVPAGLP